MWRNVGVILFIFVLPVIQVILFCLAIGRDPTNLNLAIVNGEMNDTVTLNLQNLNTQTFFNSPLDTLGNLSMERWLSLHQSGLSIFKSFE